MQDSKIAMAGLSVDVRAGKTSTDAVRAHPEGPGTPKMMVLGPKRQCGYGIWDLIPLHLGTIWVLGPFGSCST